jgi:hypothetical protein
MGLLKKLGKQLKKASKSLLKTVVTVGAIAVGGLIGGPGGAFAGALLVHKYFMDADAKKNYGDQLVKKTNSLAENLAEDARTRAKNEITRLTGMIGGIGTQKGYYEDLIAENETDQGLAFDEYTGRVNVRREEHTQTVGSQTAMLAATGNLQTGTATAVQGTSERILNEDIGSLTATWSKTNERYSQRIEHYNTVTGELDKQVLKYQEALDEVGDPDDVYDETYEAYKA